MALSGSEADADSIHAFGADEARDAVSETESVGRVSDLRSVVPSEASSELADEPGIRQRIFSWVGPVGRFPRG